MKAIKICFFLLTFSAFESCYSKSNIYLNCRILNSPLACESESKCIVLNNGVIDSIVTRSGMELHTESPFTFIYLHSGKCVEKVGECIYCSKRLELPFCILEPPCCAGNVYEYHWLQYNQQQDNIEPVFEVWVFSTTHICSKDIVWHASPKQMEILHFQLRSEPIVNDTEEDYELRQIGNVIYEDNHKINSVYELGYNKKQPEWRLCAILRKKNEYLVGWYQELVPTAMTDLPDANQCKAL